MNFQPINKSLFWGPQRSLDSEPDLNLPDPFDIEEEEIILDGNSQILLEDDVNFLSQNLPARLVGSVWHLLFSTGEYIFFELFLSKTCPEKISWVCFYRLVIMPFRKISKNPLKY